MIAGELFVSLGLTGADKLIKGLESANKQLSQIKESGLEAARSMKDLSSQFYGQVQNFSNFGGILKRFEESTGLSAETLQKFQIGLLGVGVSADDTRTSMFRLQDIMNDIQRGKPIPQSMALALRKAGIDPTQIKDIYGFVDKLRGVAKGMDVGIGRSIFADIGLTPEMFQALRRFQGEFANIRPVMTKGQFTMAEQTSNLIAKYKFQLEGKLSTVLSGKDVNRAIESIYKISLALLDLLKALIQLGNYAHIFDLLIRAFNGIKIIIDSMVEMIKSFSVEGVGKTLLNKVTGAAEFGFGVGEAIREAIIGKDYITAPEGKVSKSIGKTIAPTIKGVGSGSSHTVNNVSNTFHIDNKDPKAVANEIHRKMNPTATYRNTQSNVKR